MENIVKFSYEAIIFDLDGVITDTAKVHANAWKLIFDEYMQERVLKYNEKFTSFDLEQDYLNYVDGKPRYAGVKNFLDSRGITIPFGKPDGNPKEETICGLGNRKDSLFTKMLREKGVAVFESTIRLIKQLKYHGVHAVVATSSKNCGLILEAAGIRELFEIVVDGALSGRENLKGKPHPDIFLKSAELIKVSPCKCVIIEDAISGVQAGRNGNFGLVIGIDRFGDGNILKENGADIVLPDLAKVSVYDIEKWYKNNAKNS